MSEHDHDADDPIPRGRALTSHDDRFRDDPHPLYDRLRAHASLVPDADYGRSFLARHGDVRSVLRSDAFGVDARRSRDDSYVRRIAGTGISEGKMLYEPPLVLLDDPDHRRIRKLMSKAFTARNLEGERDRIVRAARDLLAPLRERSEIDFIADFAGPLPTRVISELMGLEGADLAALKRWSEDILWGYDPERGEDVQARLRHAYGAMSASIRGTVTARRAAPRRDLISDMVRAQEDGDRLSDLEIVSLCVQLMVAGNVTTTDLMGNGLHLLLRHRAQWDRLAAEPGWIGRAVDEMLRYDCPITETARIALDDTEVAGCPVRAGDTLTLSLSAANHDPDVFPDPHAFDVTRDASAHLAFGSGVHVCLGAPLARLEAEIGLGEFIACFPHARPGAAAPRRRRLPFFRGFESLPLIADRREARA